MTHCRRELKESNSAALTVPRIRFLTRLAAF